MRNAWKVRVAGSLCPSRRGTARATSAASASVVAGASRRRASMMARAIGAAAGCREDRGVIDAPSVVGPQRETRRAGTGVLCLVLLGLTLAALAHVAVHTRHQQVAMELGREQRANFELVEQRRKLETEIGKLKDPALLEQQARDRLCMAPPAPLDIRVVTAAPGSSKAVAP